MNRTQSLLQLLHRHVPFPNFRAVAARTEPFIRAHVLVRMYYVFLLFASVGILPHWDPALAAEIAADPLWPIRWAPFVPFPIAFAIIRTFFIATALIAAIAPERRLVRVLAAAALLEFVAFYTSALRLDIDWYVWIITAFLFVLLPDGWREHNAPPTPVRERFLLVFWAAQAVNLLTYSMAGLGKILGAGLQFWMGQTHALAPGAAVRFIADRLMSTGEVSILGPWVIAHPWIAWPFYSGVIYLLVFSMWAAFRPELHRAWGIGLILFHIANYLTINIGFSAHIFLDALLLVNSPFRDPHTAWRTILANLPLFGWMAKRI